MAVQQHAYIGVGAPRLEFGWKDHFRGAIALGDEPSLLGPVDVILLRQHEDHGAGLRVVQHDHGLARLDMLSLLDQQLLHDSAVEMLDALAVSFDLDDGLRHHGAVQRRIGGPAAQAGEEGDQHDEPGNDRAARAVAGAAQLRRIVGD